MGRADFGLEAARIRLTLDPKDNAEEVFWSAADENEVDHDLPPQPP
jgi:hypothetical protein